MDDVIFNADAEFKKIVAHLKGEYARLQIGRASAALVEDLQVEAYGTKQDLKSMASISIPDAKTIQIQPWDKSQFSAIEKAIQTSNINLTPINDGVAIRLNIPPLTEERRKELAKVVHAKAEEARIIVRNARQKGHDKIREMEKSGAATEDQMHIYEKKLQDKVDDANAEIETLLKSKEQDILTI